MFSAKLDSKPIALLKLIGLLPTRFVWRPFGGLIEIDRCRVDGAIVPSTQSGIIERHVGHELRQPVKLSLFEIFLVWVRVIR